MKRITKEMSILEILSSSPKARSILREGGIKFVGKKASPLESLELVAKANGLDEKQTEGLVLKLNESLKKGSTSGIKISLSEAAAQELRNLLSKKPGKKGFRLRLVSIGCSVYSYDLDFATKAVESEATCKAGNLTFFIEKKHRDFLNGLRIEYDSEAGGFVFDNPNMKKSESNIPVLQ